MKKHVIFIVLIVALCGCGAEVLTTTAIQGDLQAKQMKALQGQLQNATDSMGRITVQRAITAYKADQGVNPPSLAALVPTYLPEIPVKADGTTFGYDPVTGQLITGNTGVGGPTPADLKTIETIYAAINAYGQATGYYPVTLHDLVPGYLEVVPITSSGEAFLYNPQTGEVLHPRHYLAQPRRQNGVGGGGMLGETLGVIGAQEELNRMSTSADEAVRGGAGNMLGESTSDYGNRQNRMMDELGL